jgi:uncharacterized membrane protein YqiK
MTIPAVVPTSDTAAPPAAQSAFFTDAGVTVPVPPPAPAPGTYFTQADIEAARKQEKDKLYSEINNLQQSQSTLAEQLKAIQDAKDAEIAKAREEAAAAAAEQARKEWEEKDSKTLVEDVQKQFEQKFAEMERQRELERATFEKEREFAALKEYAQQRVAVAIEAGDIEPSLADFVQGNSQAEIDASLEIVKAKSEAIAQNAQTAFQSQQLATRRGVSPTGFTPTGPQDTQSQQRTFSANDIAGMSMAEYAKFRQQAGIGAGSESNQGLFGR